MASTQPLHAYLRERQVLWLLFFFYALTFSVLASVVLKVHGFPLDDSYIHQTVARNFATYGIPGFIMGQRSSGTTSLLWTLIQAFNYRFLHAIDPTWYNLAISLGLVSLIGVLLYVIARRDGLPHRICLMLAVAPAMLGNFLWLGTIGMEHLLFVVLSLLGIVFWLNPETGSSRSAWGAGIAAGLLVITRPEASLYVVLLLILGYKARPQRPKADYAKLVGIWALFLLISFAANWWTSRSWMPTTMKGRTWLYFHGSGGAHSARSISRFIGSWIERLPRMFSTSFTGQPHSCRDLAGAGCVLGVVLFGLIVAGAVTLARYRGPGTSLLLCWAAVHFGLYLILFPAAGHGGRYQPLCLLLAFPLLLIGLDACLGAVLHGKRSLHLALLLFVWIGGGASSMASWRQVTRLGIFHINNTHGQAALWLNQRVPLGAKVAAFDIGRVSYDWRGQIIDLGGLVDPTYVSYLEQRKVPQYLAMKQVQYLLLPSKGMEDIGIDPERLSAPLVQYCSPTSLWLLGFRYTIHATPCQTLYQLR